jgi:hypothetical protein
MVDWAMDPNFMGWLRGQIAAIVAGGSGAIIGTGRVQVALAAGATNNLNPGSGFPTAISRLILTSAAGAANVTGLLAGSDGQFLMIQNDGPNNVTLNSENAGSVATNQFSGAADLILVADNSTLAVYDATEGFWILV